MFAAIGATAVLLAAVSVLGTGFGLSRMMLTSVALTIASLLIQVLLVGTRTRLLYRIFGLALVAGSQVFFLLIVWTAWRTEPTLWRYWWTTAIAAVCWTQLHFLRGQGRTQLAGWGLATPAGALVSGLLLMGLVWGRSPLPEYPIWYWLLLVPPSLVSVVGSLKLWLRTRPPRAQRPALSPAVRWGLLLLSHAAMLFGGLYLGKSLSSDDALFRQPSALLGMSGPAIERGVERDLSRLRAVLDGRRALRNEVSQFHAALEEAMQSEDRDYLTPPEEDRIRAQFSTFLRYRSVLLRLVGTYQGFEAVREPGTRARCFLLGFAAAASMFHDGLYLVHTYYKSPVSRRKLNEADYGLPEGTLDQVFEAVTDVQTIRLLDEMSAYFEHRRADWGAQGVFPGEDFEFLCGAISGALEAIEGLRLNPHLARIERFFDHVQRDAYRPAYAVQALAARWIGDTRIVNRESFISQQQVEEVRARLKPGDILIVRKNWYLSNAFLPGFWPHAALYVGGLEDLERLGVLDDPEVASRLEEFSAPADDGSAFCVIEAQSEGVVFNPLSFTLHADYVAVLRPRELSQDEIALAIRNAFRYQGRPYDFEFDFFSSDKLVCTELVYRAYAGDPEQGLRGLHFQLEKVAGRDTLPANRVIAKFRDEQARPDRELELVLFLDTPPGRHRAQESDAATLGQSIERPGTFNE